MIVSGTKELMKHCPSVNWKVEGTRLNDFIDRAQQWVVERILGTDIEDLLEEDIAEGQSDPHEKLRKLASRAICEKSYLDAIAEMDLQLSEAGFVVQSNDAVSPASQQRTEQLRKSLDKRLTDDCDSLVKYLLFNSRPDNAYENWRGTQQFMYLTASFTPTCISVLNKIPLTIQLNWDDFYNSIPKMEHALHTTVAKYCSIEQIEKLLELYRDDELLREHYYVFYKMSESAAIEVFEDKINASVRAVEARNYMLKHLELFPDFAESDKRELPGINFDAGGIVNTL